MKVVLQIEDNRGDVDLLRQAFEDLGATIDLQVVENGALAVRYLMRRDMFADAPRPDLILLDLNMPLMNGHSLLAILKEHEDWRRIPVVVLTSSERAEDQRATLALGAAQFCTKPSGYDDFLAVVQSILALPDPTPRGSRVQPA